MNLLSWFSRFGLTGRIAKNARVQFVKWQIRSPELSEAEVAQAMFDLRYAAPTPPLNRDEFARYASYMDSEFSCNSLIDFCFTSLDIEGGLDPTDRDLFLDVAGTIERELCRLGHDVFPPHPANAVDFRVRWLQQVSPLR